MPRLRPRPSSVRAGRTTCAIIAVVCAVLLCAPSERGARGGENVKGSFGVPSTRPLRRRGQPPPAPTRPSSPIPNLITQDVAAERIRSIYVAEYANTSYDARRALARKLIEQGDGTMRDSDAKFVFYAEATRLAAAAGDVPTAFDGADHLATAFPVVKLVERVKILQTSVPVLVAPAANQAVVSMCMDLVDQCAVENEFDHAATLLDLAATAAEKSQKQAYASWVRWKRDRVEAMRLAYGHVKPAAGKLGNAPDDPAANLTVGRFTCLVKKDWDVGLPMIEKGNDEALSALAERDLTCPDDNPWKQFELADAWWAWGEKCSAWDDELNVDARARYRERAAYWYRLALPALDGLDRATAERRSAEVYPPAGSEAAKARYVPRPPDAMPFKQHKYRAHIAEVPWDTARRLCEEAGGHLVCLETRLENDYVVKLSRGKTLWLGATFDAKGKWTWIGGTGMFFSYWAHEQPDLSDPRLRPQMTPSGAWRTSATTAGFICEWDE